MTESPQKIRTNHIKKFSFRLEKFNDSNTGIQLIHFHQK